MTSTSSGWLGRLERIGNRLPHPTLLFVWLCLLMLPLSALLALLGVTAEHPLEDRTIVVRSLLDGEGLRYVFTHLVGNFTGFAPLGVVLVAMLGWASPSIPGCSAPAWRPWCGAPPTAPWWWRWRSPG